MDHAEADYARKIADKVAKEVAKHLGTEHPLAYETEENLKDDVYCAVAAALTYEADQKVEN
jgi:hypothetical protein